MTRRTCMLAGRAVEAELEDAGLTGGFTTQGAPLDVYRSWVRINGAAVGCSDTRAELMELLAPDERAAYRKSEDCAFIVGAWQNMGGSDAEGDEAALILCWG